MPLTTPDVPTVAGALPAGGAQAQPLVAVRVLLPFRLPGQDDPQPGEVLQLRKPLALELAMYRKVDLIPTTTVAAPDPAPPADAETRPAARGKAQGAPAP